MSRQFTIFLHVFQGLGEPEDRDGNHSRGPSGLIQCRDIHKPRRGEQGQALVIQESMIHELFLAYYENRMNVDERSRKASLCQRHS